MRKPLPLTERDLHDLERMSDDGSPQYRALRSLLGGEPGSSDSALLHAVLEIGLRAVEEEARQEGYLKLAESRSTDDERELKILRDRRRHRALTDE